MTELHPLSLLIFLCVCVKIEQIYEDGLTSETTVLFLNTEGAEVMTKNLVL